MNVGELRHRVAVLNPSAPVSDGAGGFSVEWSSASPGEVWAKVEPSSSRTAERLAGLKLEASYSHVVTVRYHAEITARTRLTLGARVFAVRGVVDPLERHEWLIVAVDEVAS
jgi:hypothetical protein